MNQGALKKWKEIGHFDFSKLPDNIEVDDQHTYGDLWDDKGAYEGIMNVGRNSDGFGRYVTPEGIIKEGLFKGSMQSGLGRIFYTNGDYYEGEFEGDLKNGKGRHVKSGMVEEGTF